MQQPNGSAQLSGSERLFLSLSEELMRPWHQVAKFAELGDGADWPLVRAIADGSMQLLESYALSLRVHGRVMPLELQPVTVSSLLYDTAEALQPFAKHYGVTLDLDTGPRLQPVIADRTVLRSAMLSLGQVFVTASAESEDDGPVLLSAHRSRYGIVAGLYSPDARLGADSLRRAHGLHGRARQPLSKLVSGPAAGVFVADSLLHALSAHLHVARLHKLSGLATTLAPSRQMQLI